MPNHCQNVLLVSGPRNAIEFFKAVNYNAETKEPITFDGIVPRSRLRNLTISGSNEKALNAVPIACGVKDNWYDWCVSNWGTKWDAYDQDQCEVPLLLQGHDKWKEANAARVDTDIAHAHFRFTTAWSPPGHWLEACKKLFPMLDFQIKWREEGGEYGFLEPDGTEGPLDDDDSDLPAPQNDDEE